MWPNLFPGMTANVKILVSQRKNVLLASNAALPYHPASGAITAAGKGAAPEKAVWLLDAKEKPQRVVVTTGESDGTNTEVTTGTLKDGDRVIVAALAKTDSAPGGSPGSQAAGKGSKGPGF